MTKQLLRDTITPEMRMRAFTYSPTQPRESEMTQTKQQAQDEAITLLHHAATTALFALGHEGANSDLKHPLRPAWEACSLALAKAFDANLLNLRKGE